MSSQTFCPNCGMQNSSTAKYCEGCGNEILKSNDFGTEVSNSISTYSKVASNTGIQYADDGKRLVAFILDGILFSIIAGIIGLIFGQNWWFGLGLGGNIWSDSYPSLIAGLLYFFCMEAFNKGQTLGKMAMKIRTVNETTYQSLTYKEAFLHVVGKALFVPIDVIAGLILRNDSNNGLEKNQLRLCQRFSHTSVIIA